MSEVGNDDRSTYDQGDVESIVQFFVRKSGLDTTPDMIVDTVVAPQHRRRDQTKQLLGSTIERTVAIRRRIESEETLRPQMTVLIQNEPIQSIPFRLEFRESILMLIH